MAIFIRLGVSLLVFAVAVNGYNQSAPANCSAAWPEMDLFLPLYVSPTNPRNHEWRDIFLKSLLMHWPLATAQVGLTLILDEEIKGHGLVNEVVTQPLKKVSKHFSRTQVIYDKPSEYYHNKGHDRQQLIMFNADKSSNAEFVGFVDTDCLFTTYTDRGDLFEDNKPVINGRIGRSQNMYWDPVPATSFAFTGLLEPMRCMNYFPVVIKRTHLADLREYVIKYVRVALVVLFAVVTMTLSYVFAQHGGQLSFPEIFAMHTFAPYSQFGILCTYLWYEKRDEYAWYVHDTDPSWDWHNQVQGNVRDKSIFTPEMYYPKPRIASHVRYRTDKIFAGSGNKIAIKRLIDLGQCFSPPFPKPNNSFCKLNPSTADQENVIFDEMHKFELTNWVSITPFKDLLQAQRDRYHRIKDCPFQSIKY